MSIDTLHPHRKPNIRTTSFSFLFWRFRERLCYEKEDGVPWDSMVGVREIGNWCEYETLGIYSVESHRGSVGERLWLEPVQLLSLSWRYSEGTESKDFLWWVGLWWNGAVIVAILGNRIECELAGVRKWFLTPALKLQRSKTKACTGALI